MVGMLIEEGILKDSRACFSKLFYMKEYFSEMNLVSFC